MALELQLLGPFVAAYDGRPLESFRSSKAQALLAYLVTEAAFASGGQAYAHGREQVMTLLWPRTPQKSAQVNLRQTLYQLRQAIPEVGGPDGGRVPFILSDRQTVQVNPNARYDLDVARLLLSGALLDGEPSPSEMAEAVALYRGPFLSDFHLPDSETFEAWVAGRRATLERMALEALEALAEHHLERAEGEEAERNARRQIALDELRESGHRQLLRALAQQGRRNATVAHYETYCELLEEELGLAPSAEMEALMAAVRAGQPITVGEGEGEGDGAPTGRAGRETGRKRRRLPHRATPFVGRRREMEEVTARLEDGCQLVTLLGPGGTGKTRLGIEVARNLSGRYRHGATFVELAPISDPGAIPVAIATALDFRFSGDGSPREQVLNYLANKELLLVLDNVEHVLEGAGLVDDLLGVAPDVRLLATSRARLNLGAECLFEVGGLATPESGSAEAVEMFIAYACRVQPGFDPDEKGKRAITRICRLVEGMPLAIELAASWVRALPPQEIARELAEGVDFLESERADLPARQRSMRAAFDHSWKLLDEDGREALMKLSVFRGGASRKAARAITGASLRALLALADHSLLTMDPDSGRFAVHELIRQFAEERLEEAGDAEAVRDAHSEYYLRALAGRLRDLKGRDQLGALEAIEGDFENVRAAWRWALRQGQWEDFPEASQSLFLFGLFRERQLDGIELFEAVRKALPAPATLVAQLTRAYALAGGQWLLSWIGSHEEALTAVAELKTAVEVCADPAAVAYCQMTLGQVLLHGTGPGEYPAEAIAALEEAHAHYQQAGDPFYSALVLWRLGYAHWRAGQERETLDVERRGLAPVREAGDRFVAGMLMNNLGATLESLGRREAADRYIREAAELQREIGAWGSYAFTLTNLATNLLWRDADLEQSRPMVEEAHAIAAEQNKLQTRTHALDLLCGHRILEGRYEEALALTAELLALAKENTEAWHAATFKRGLVYLAGGDTHDAVSSMSRGLSWWKDDAHASYRASELFSCLAYCTIPLAQSGEHERAAELLALGLTDPSYRGGLEIDPLLARTRAELEEALGEEAFAAAWERGEKLDPLVVLAEMIAALEEMEAAVGNDAKS